jgi:hypothetical protein
MWGMGRNSAILRGFLLGGLLMLAAAPACAQGFHFGGGFQGFRLGGPRFDGPRFDGPRLREPVDVPSPHEPVPPPQEAVAPPREPLAPPPPELAGSRKCFNPAETRARVAQFKLLAPFEMMRRASHLADAQALAGKLCRWVDLDIYDISLLRPDGRVVHVFLDALTGREVSAPRMN